MKTTLTILWQSINTIVWIKVLFDYLIDSLPIILTGCTIVSTVCFTIYLLRGIKKRNLEIKKLENE